jgi:hypothetical protein
MNRQSRQPSNGGGASGLKTAGQLETQPQSRGEFAVALAAIALSLALLLGPVLLSDRMFAMRDAGHYYYPLFKWCADTWGDGRLPLWNPNENGGVAVCADPTASLWYPGKLLFALPFSFALRLKLYIVGHVVLCAVGGYWLARRWQASVYGSALAALSYAGGGSVVFLHCNVVYLVGAAWLPFALGHLDGVLRERQYRSVASLAVVLALMVLGGDPQMAYHVLLIGGLYAVVLASGRRGSPDGAGSSLLAGLGLVAAAAGIALLLAAAPTTAMRLLTTSSRLPMRSYGWRKDRCTRRCIA